MEQQKIGKTTTIKLSRATKGRLDNLKVFKRESYEDILQNILSILNICRINPERAKARLITIERQKKRSQRLFVRQALKPKETKLQ